MKAKELSDLLLQYPDFDVDICLCEPDGSSYGLGCRTFDVTGIADIGHSVKIIQLDIREE
jgi:hypothetical protein